MTDTPEADPSTADTAELGPAPKVTDLDARRIGEALTGWAQVAVGKTLEGLALAEQRWKATAKAWLRPAGDPWPAGHVRLTLRAVAEREVTDEFRAQRRDYYLRAGEHHRTTADETLTEEHHSIVDLADIAAELVAGTLVTALGELAGIVAPQLRARLVRAGVLERPPSVIGPGVIVPR